jgi:hemerythrin-like domain-containing protein
MSELLSEPALDFSDPLGLLRACHQRILQHCEILNRLAAHLKENGVDDQARDAARKVRFYFSTAGKHHHEDEEQDLFPKLIRQSLKMADIINSLKQDHKELERLWAELDPLLSKPTAIEDVDAFASLAAQFDEIYRRHVDRENSELLELARHILSSKQLQEMGKAMAQRRGVKV